MLIRICSEVISAFEQCARPEAMSRPMFETLQLHKCGAQICAALCIRVIECMHIAYIVSVCLSPRVCIAVFVHCLRLYSFMSVVRIWAAVKLQYWMVGECKTSSSTARWGNIKRVHGNIITESVYRQRWRPFNLHFDKISGIFFF